MFLNVFSPTSLQFETFLAAVRHPAIMRLTSVNKRMHEKTAITEGNYNVNHKNPSYSHRDKKSYSFLCHSNGEFDAI